MTQRAGAVFDVPRITSSCSRGDSEPWLASILTPGSGAESAAFCGLPIGAGMASRRNL